MRATVTGVLRHVDTKTDSKGKKFAIASLEQVSSRGKPYFVQVCTYDIDAREIGNEETFEVTLRASGANGARAFLNAWEVRE